MQTEILVDSVDWFQAIKAQMYLGYVLDSHYVVSWTQSVDTFFLSGMVTEIFCCPMSNQACIIIVEVAI